MGLVRSGGMEWSGEGGRGGGGGMPWSLRLEGAGRKSLGIESVRVVF